MAVPTTQMPSATYNDEYCNGRDHANDERKGCDNDDGDYEENYDGEFRR